MLIKNKYFMLKFSYNFVMCLHFFSMFLKTFIIFVGKHSEFENQLESYRNFINLKNMFEKYTVFQKKSEKHVFF